MALTATQFTLLCVVGIILLARPAHAFGAGNIGSTSKIEGENWRHGDLEDTLLSLVASRAMGGKKFSKLDVKRVYFGNWLRDYSQAVDVGTVKYVSAEAIRLLLWILGFMSFGYGTKEFEVTTERLGCYRPEEHIDNPKNYADNEDARRYDRRLRGPINERVELAIDPELGLKAYIASENLGIDTSAALVRNLFSESIQLGRRYARSKNKADLYEALRLLGTGCHCLEDFSAHSNYTELALIELGERGVFPHVGRNTQVRLRGARSPVWPLVTGTFGGVDFLHSVTGEFNDKVTQSEIQELEGTLNQAQSQGQNKSALQDLLNKIPNDIFGGKDESSKADELEQNAAQHQMRNTQISPREPEEWLQYVNDVRQQIYPIIEWHDEVMQSITETIDAIPILPDLIEHLQEQVNIFVFSLLAPYVLPIIGAVKNELNTGSNAIIQSSMEQQHIVFSDDDCSDPTHSMLSKDHFSNILNEPAGKVAGQVLRWVVPQLIEAWDDDRVDIDRTLNRIIRGVFHHPALRGIGDDGAAKGRQLMFSVVENWWSEKSEREKNSLRDQLSRDGVEEGRNHKPGVKDHGHGSAKKLGMPNVYTASHPGAPGGLGGVSAGFGSNNPAASQASEHIGRMANEAVGGGALGSIVGGIAGAVGGGVLAEALGGDDNNNNKPAGRGGRDTYDTSYGDDGSRTQTAISSYGRPGGPDYGRSEYSRTDDRYGGRSEEYRSQESGYQSGRTGYQGGSKSEQQSSYEPAGSHDGYGSDTRSYQATTQTSTYGSGRRDEYGGGGRDTTSFGAGGMPGGFGVQEQVGGYSAQETQSYGRRRDDDISGGRFGGEREISGFGARGSEYGSSNIYGSRQQEPERETYGARGGEYGSSTGYDGRREEPERETYGGYHDVGGGYSAGYDRTEDRGEPTTYSRSGGAAYGSARREGEPGYEGRRKKDDSDDEKKYRRKKKDDSDDDNDDRRGGAYRTKKKDDSDDDDNRRRPAYGSGYGGRKKDNDSDDDNDKRYRHKKKDDDDSDDEKKRKKYGGGSYGRRDDDDDNERRGQYGGGGYSSGGYGGGGYAEGQYGGYGR